MMVSLRTVAFDAPPQDVITRDNVSVKVPAWSSISESMDPTRAVIEVENYLTNFSVRTNDVLEASAANPDFDELLAARDKINLQIQEILASHTEPWGVKVSMVEVKQIDLPGERLPSASRQAGLSA